MGFKERNADFSKAMADLQLAYIGAEREVKDLQKALRVSEDGPRLQAAIWDAKRLKVENAELRSLASRLYEFAYGEYPDGAESNFASELRRLGVDVWAGD